MEVDYSTVKSYSSDQDSYPWPHGHIRHALTSWANSPSARGKRRLHNFTIADIPICMTNSQKVCIVDGMVKVLRVPLPFVIDHGIWNFVVFEPRVIQTNAIGYMVLFTDCITWVPLELRSHSVWTGFVGWIGEANASHMEGQEDECWLSQTNDLHNWYPSLATLALGNTRTG